MKRINFKKCQFIASSVGEKSYPNLAEYTPSHEIAFVGRSNVGKSSLINDITLNRKMAKVSSTPGKTQHINFFIVDSQFTLVDLPGYGFAKVSKSLKKGWDYMISKYLEERVALSHLFILIDSRHTMQNLDLEMVTYALESNIAFTLIFTKTDKLKKSVRKKQCESLLEEFEKATGFHGFTTIHYSINESSSKTRLTSYIQKEIITHEKTS